MWGAEAGRLGTIGRKDLYIQHLTVPNVQARRKVGVLVVQRPPACYQDFPGRVSGAALEGCREAESTGSSFHPGLTRTPPHLSVVSTGIPGNN